MKKFFPLIVFACLIISSCAPTKEVVAQAVSEPSSLPSIDGEYTLVVEGFDWGAAASKVILSLEQDITEVNNADYEVVVNRATDCATLSPQETTGKLKVLFAYVSDEKGKRAASGNHVTLVLYAAPFESINAPIKYFGQNPKCKGNHWIDFDLTVTNNTTKQVWNKEKNKIIPLIDDFDLTGSYTHKDITMSYACFDPSVSVKAPLIIWLHGGGEGGPDASIPLLANRAANYAAPEMQSFFGVGAYVLVPQAPSFWMDKGDGTYTRGEVDDMYNQGLMALIEDYVNRNPMIDKDRIYLGGCSNGGYMTLKLMMQHPDYFAAGFPSALAYHAKNLSEDNIQNLKDQSIWFIHSKDDPVTIASETATPVYQKLIAAGAKGVHYSLFDHVVDITNQFGGEDYHYLGHFSWIYSHTNKCQLDYDGTPVIADGHPVTLMGWLARQQLSGK